MLLRTNETGIHTHIHVYDNNKGEENNNGHHFTNRLFDYNGRKIRHSLTMGITLLIGGWTITMAGIYVSLLETTPLQ